jgi:hypothetical protein
MEMNMKNDSHIQLVRSPESRGQGVWTVPVDKNEQQTIVLPAEKDFPVAVQQAVTQIRTLRRYTEQTGFKTTRSQNDILQKLEGEDLANALLLLDKGTVVPRKNQAV